jgi:hypothetical protein
MNFELTSKSVYGSLIEYGVALFSPIYNQHCINKWNEKLDCFFKHEVSVNRNYVRADQLHTLGILESILNKDLQDLISSLMSDAVLYHCHVYEIEGEQKSSHIHADNGLDGWHRDEDCLYAVEKNQLHHFSMFVYLSDVADENGPFQIAPLSAFDNLKRNTPSLRITGQRGTCFLFDRTFLHRATPNQSITRRRVLKLSFQNKGLFNDRIFLPEFTEVKESLIETNSDISHWFGAQLDEASHVA